MEGAGMRWTVAGVQALLRVRAVYLNGAWQEFLDKRMETEQERLYGRRDQETPLGLAV
jgi:serine protease inhibitor